MPERIASDAVGYADAGMTAMVTTHSGDGWRAFARARFACFPVNAAHPPLSTYPSARRARRLGHEEPSPDARFPGKQPVPENRERPQLQYRDGRAGGRRTGLLTRILAVAGGAIVLAGAVAISLVVFAIALAGIVIFGLYVWWKTRHLRKQLREQHANGPVVDDDVIEGEVIRKDEPPRTP